LRTLVTEALPTTLTGGTVAITATHYVYIFNASGTIKWGL
jgi:hypothetical protein